MQSPHHATPSSGFGHLLSLMRIALIPALLLGAATAHAQPVAYVAHMSAGVVTVIDTTANAPVGTIPVGASPTRVSVTRDGTTAYVGNSAGSSVSVIDAASRTVVATIPVSANPSDLVVSPNGAWLYVMLSTGVVEVVDTVTRTVLATIPVGGTGGIAVTPDGSRVYVGAGNVVVIDTATNTVLSYFTGDSGFSASGGVVVVDTASDTITKTVWLGALPGVMAVTPDGSRAYVAIDAVWVNTGYGAAFLPGRTIAVIDAVTDTAAASIDLGAAGANWTLQNTAKGLAISPDRRSVYASVPRLSVVSVADVNTNLVTASISVTPSPSGIGAASGSAALVPYVIDAVDDSATMSSAGGDAVANVLSNDRLGGLRPSLAHVSLSEVSSDTPGLALDIARGAVTVAPGTELGTYALVYRICETAAPSNCDNATVSVTVRVPFVIDAVDDAGTAFPGRTIASVLANDTLAGAPATLAGVALTQLSSTNAAVALNPSSGTVSVAAGAAYGTSTVAYRICEKASLVNCDDAVVTVTVVPYAVDAVDDAGIVTRAGGTAVANVLANDRFAGSAATLASVTLALEGTAPAGLSLNLSTGAVVAAAGTPTGVHTLGYRICEKTRVDNCDTATVTVTVNAYLIVAVNDAGRGSSKVANTPIASVLTNDTLGGAPATTSSVVLSRVSLTPASSKIRLDLTDGSVDVLGKTTSGLYALVYRICERASPTNCAQATATIDLSGR